MTLDVKALRETCLRVIRHADDYPEEAVTEVSCNGLLALLDLAEQQHAALELSPCECLTAVDIGVPASGVAYVCTRCSCLAAGRAAGIGSEATGGEK